MNVTEDRLTRQIAFIVELDKLKHVLRQTTLTDSSRQENSAEHSWHLALMATLLAEYADQPVDVGRVIKMVLLHDVVEIDAGDTFCYDAQGVLDQAAREQRAADRLFGLLPEDQQQEFLALWQEFEARATAEARFAAALDRLQPLLQNLHTQGGTWARHGITLAQVKKRMAPVPEISTSLGEYMTAALDEAVSRGYIRES
jgi:putative hydrolase of HD superfamily